MSFVSKLKNRFSQFGFSGNIQSLHDYLEDMRDPSRMIETYQDILAKAKSSVDEEHFRYAVNYAFSPMLTGTTADVVYTFDLLANAAGANEKRQNMVAAWALHRIKERMTSCPNLRGEKAIELHNQMQVHCGQRPALSEKMLTLQLHYAEPKALRALWRESSAECLGRAHAVTSGLVAQVYDSAEQGLRNLSDISKAFFIPVNTFHTLSGVIATREPVVFFVPDYPHHAMGWVRRNNASLRASEGTQYSSDMSRFLGAGRPAAKETKHRQAIVKVYEAMAPDMLLSAWKAKTPLDKAVWSKLPADHPFVPLRKSLALG